MLRKLLDFVIFSSLYISCCAIAMVHQTIQLFNLSGSIWPFYGFVFFATLCSYNIHWYFTPFARNERDRSLWTREHRQLQFLLAIIGGIAAACFVPFLLEKLIWLVPSILLTFLYTAPKIPGRVFSWLKKIAIGKTVYLAFVWMYVTTALPLLIYNAEWTNKEILFCCSRFFLIYAICIIFDYRDREQDKLDGIKSLVTFFGEKGINRIFVLSLIACIIATILLHQYSLSWRVIFCLLLPGVIVGWLFPLARKNFSDYLYYLVLDGMMMFSALCMLLLSI